MKKDIELNRFILCTECIIENEGRFLVIKRPQGVHAGGLLAFPGGGVERFDGEQNNNVVKTAILREVKEEVGIQLLDPLHLLTSSYFMDEKEHLPVVDFVFHCKLKMTNATVIPHPREVPEHFWLSKDEIDNHPNAPIWIKRYISLVDEV